jgi:hypothetical protein
MVRWRMFSLIAASVLSHSCSSEQSLGICDAIENPENFFDKDIKITGVAIYDEFPMLYSEKPCPKFDNKTRYLSLSINYGDENLTNFLYGSRNKSNKIRYGSKIEVSGRMRKFDQDGQKYFYLQVSNYKKYGTVRF